jgi:hypothetical protein
MAIGEGPVPAGLDERFAPASAAVNDASLIGERAATRLLGGSGAPGVLCLLRMWLAIPCGRLAAKVRSQCGHLTVLARVEADVLRLIWGPR